MKKKKYIVLGIIMIIIMLILDTIISIYRQEPPIVSLSSPKMEFTEGYNRGLLVDFKSCEDGTKRSYFKWNNYNCSIPTIRVEGLIKEYNEEYIEIEILNSIDVIESNNIKISLKNSPEIIGSDKLFLSQIIRTDVDKKTIDAENKLVKKIEVIEDTFKDENLKNAIFEILKIDDINELTPNKISGVTRLDLEDRNIKDIKGIEIFQNLEILDIKSNNIRDISYLKYLKLLKSLFMMDNLIDDIQSLSYLENLEIVNMENNEIKDLTPINELENLQTFIYNGNPIINFGILYNKVDEMTKNKYNSEIFSYMDNATREQFIKEEIERQKSLLESNQNVVEQLKAWTKENIKSTMSDLEKEFAIIDHIAERLSYNYDTTSYISLDDMYNQNKSVCFGYTLIFQYLLDLSEIENYKVFAKASDGNPIGHVWNAVKIDNTYYEVDLTWYDANDEIEDYKFINRSSDKMDLYHGYAFIPNQKNILPIMETDMPIDIKCQNRSSVCLNSN